jgi:uncharacterized protein (DUF2141 family)|tara:strand:+ start:799 stop:1245 length:447 start_codon:yes stop_codon:yes gene_type:complete
MSLGEGRPVLSRSFERAWGLESQRDGGLARLVVAISDEEDRRGLVGVALWAGAEGFPEVIDHALRTSYVERVDGKARVMFDGLEWGRYAVTVYHDRNDNRRFDKNWIGMPKEAWGVSNNVRPRLRGPRFDEAVFEVGAGEHVIEIRID